MHELIDRAMVCAGKWCRDILQPLDAESLHDACDGSSQIPPDDTVGIRNYYEWFIDRLTTSRLSFGHQTIQQFVRQKAEDGTLIDMAGRSFEPRLAWLNAFVELCRCARDLFAFAAVFERAMSVFARVHADTKLLADLDLSDGILKCLTAIDQIGHTIDRPVQGGHWTHNQLNHWASNPVAKPTDDDSRLLGRAPAGFLDISFESYLISLDPDFGGVVHLLIERRSNSLTNEQKQFVLETALVPSFYGPHSYEYGGYYEPTLYAQHRKLIMKIVESGIDVNQPTRRFGCRSNYSVWQFFLLWLHDYFHQDWWDICTLDVEGFAYENAQHESAGFEHTLSIFRTFLEYGADPYTVIMSEDLIQCYLRNPAARKTTFLSVTDVVGDLERAAQDAATSVPDAVRDEDSTYYEFWVTWCAAWAETTSGFRALLTEASARRFAASNSTQLSMGSWGLAPSRFSA